MPGRPRLGQHFLVSGHYVRELADAARLTKGDRVFEIGTGRGRLTRELASRCSLVRTFEIDRRFYDDARSALLTQTNVQVELGDALSEDAKGFQRVVSSLPYYLSGRFVEWFAGQDAELAALLVQDEFADKLLAPVGSRKYGAHSVLSQYAFEMHRGPSVPKSAFAPRPLVNSVIFTMERRRKVEHAQSVAKSLKILFSFRGRKVGSAEKTLLKRFGLREGSWNVDRSRRVEDLTPEEAIDLSKSVEVVGG